MSNRPIIGLQIGHILLDPRFVVTATIIRVGKPVFKAGIGTANEQIIYLRGVLRLGEGDANRYQTAGVITSGYVEFYIPVNPGTPSPIQIGNELGIGDYLLYDDLRWKAIYEKDYSDSGYYYYKFQRLTKDGKENSI